MRSFIIDTIATIVFFTLLAAATEIFIAGMDFKEMLTTRLIMIPMMVLTGRPYGMWRDWVFKRVDPQAVWSKTLTDSLAFMAFQLPIYAMTLMFAGADANEILTLLASTSLIMLVISRPFGMYLEMVRAWAGSPAQQN